MYGIHCEEFKSSGPKLTSKKALLPWSFSEMNPVVLLIFHGSGSSRPISDHPPIKDKTILYNSQLHLAL